MHINSRLFLPLLTIISSLLAANGQNCSYGGRTGICINTNLTKCNGILVSSGCTGSRNIGCCLTSNKQKRSNNGVGQSCSDGNRTGTCIDTDVSSCSNGTLVSNRCPGGKNVKCCLRSSSPTGSNNGVGQSCSDGNRTGTCIDTDVSSCSNGTLISNRCPGGKNVKCCINGKSPLQPNNLLAMAEYAADYAREHANPSTTRRCARYVGNALIAAGFQIEVKDACYYHSEGILSSVGFRLLPSRPATLKKGDIAVYECNRTHEYGHIQIYDGYGWYSDFRQNNEIIYSSDIPPIHYYRI